MQRSRDAASGLAYALAAYVAWGLFPVYFHALAGVPALEVLANRVVWSAAFLALLLAARGRMGAVAELLRRPRRLAMLAVSAVLVSANWLMFIWAVGHGHVVDSSLGYFVTPLVSVLLARVFLGETLGRVQVAALALAAAGVAVLLATSGARPWIAAVVALSFSGYGLVRKAVAVDPVAGLFVETLVLAPAAAGFLLAGCHPAGGVLVAGGRTALLLVLAGLITAVALIWFVAGVQRLRLSTAGILFYVNPTLQLAVAVLLFGEPFTRTHALAFGCSWASLALYSAEALRTARRAVTPPAPHPPGGR